MRFAEEADYDDGDFEGYGDEGQQGRDGGESCGDSGEGLEGSGEVYGGQGCEDFEVVFQREGFGLVPNPVFCVIALPMVGDGRNEGWRRLFFL